MNGIALQSLPRSSSHSVGGWAGSGAGQVAHQERAPRTRASNSMVAAAHTGAAAEGSQPQASSKPPAPALVRLKSAQVAAEGVV